MAGCETKLAWDGANSVEAGVDSVGRHAGNEGDQGVRLGRYKASELLFERVVRRLEVVRDRSRGLTPSNWKRCCDSSSGYSGELADGSGVGGVEGSCDDAGATLVDPKRGDAAGGDPEFYE